MPKVNEMLLKLESFKYYASIDLNVVYYLIQLSENGSNLCTTIPPWEKFHYNGLPMVFSNPPKKFHQKMNYLFQRF